MLFVGDDRVEDHHEIEVQDETGRRLATARLPEGIEGISRLHALLAAHLPEEWVDPDSGMIGGRVVVGIVADDQGPWARGLVAAGYQVYAIDPGSVARHREHDATPEATSDAAVAAHLLADVVRLDQAHHRRVDGDGLGIEGLRPVASIHQSLIWDRERQVLRLRGALQEYFPVALTAFEAAGLDLTSAAALELLRRAPDPDLARNLSRSKITAALKRAHCQDAEAKAAAIRAVLRAPGLRQPAVAQRAHATIVSSQVRLLIVVIGNIADVETLVAEGLWPTPGR